MSYIKHMSSKLEIVRHNPVGYWPMDSASPFVDHSGYSLTSTAAGGTPTKSVSLSRGAQYSTVLTQTITVSFSTPVFRQGYEESPFTLSADIRAYGDAGDQKVLSNLSNYDGIIVNGTSVSFVIKYLTTGECRVSYDIQVPRRISITGVYDVDKILLYIDGQLVGQSEVSEDQRSDQFISTNNTLYSGATSSSQKIAINNVATYPRAVDAGEVQQIYLSSQNTGDVPTMYGGVSHELGSRENITYLKQIFDNNDDWQSGTAMDVRIQDDSLVPTFQSNVSLPGFWIGNFQIGSTESATIFGVNINWDGIGAIIEASLDGITWESVTRGKNIDLVPPGFNPTDKILLVRVTFPGGTLNDQSYLDSLTLTGYSTGISTSLNDRTITYAGDIDIRENKPVLDLSDDWGVNLTGGSVVIGADPNAETIRTAEIWVKAGSGLTRVGLSSSGGGAAYVNGIGGGTLPVGEWAVMHIVSATNITEVTLSGGAQVGRISYYKDALTTTDVQNIYASYVGTKTARYSDSNSITVAETAGSTQIYAHEWAILSSG